VKPLWSVRMSAKQRWGLLLIFAMGLLVCMAGVLRSYYLQVYYDSVDELCMYHAAHG
jgi:ABC-type bacteriocin/lantibiotic exporter with double-glycine peptidase domain